MGALKYVETPLKMVAALDQIFSTLIPDWPLPTGVRSVVTTRPVSQMQGGSTIERFLGLAPSIQLDTPQYKNVQSARTMLAEQLGLSLTPQWLQQEHGLTVVRASANGVIPIADASFTRESGLACAVLTADCLPLLLSAKDGSLVAAIHGGWRGLASGVIGTTVAALNIDPGQLMAYLGPAISAQHFEVGPEVRQAFLDACLRDGREEFNVSEIANCFRPSDLSAGHYFADLYGLARMHLKSLGVTDVFGGEYCTYAQESQFYSHRRSRDIGRMASLIWIEG